MFGIILIIMLYAIEKLSNSVCFFTWVRYDIYVLIYVQNLCDDFCFAMLSSRIKKNLF